MLCSINRYSVDNFEDTYIHLTNTSINKENPFFNNTTTNSNSNSTNNNAATPYNNTNYDHTYLDHKGKDRPRIIVTEDDL